MIKRFTALVAAGALALPVAFAETIDANPGAVATDASAPQRGMTMSRVESGWGQPQTRRAAVGQPPITRWEYNGFTVYFEYDRVIHTVLDNG
ncbi:MAG: hypothetical protein AAGL69_07985 [Pseudomonadota bacterium]